MKSGRLYSFVTKYWPRIAAAFIAGLGIIELVLGGLTSDSGLELYLTVWAAMTGGVWFFFEKAEHALGEQSREKVVSWVTETDLEGGIESIPDQFAALFDRVFGDRQLSLRCFVASGIASTVAALAVCLFFMVILAPDDYDLMIGTGESPVRLTTYVDWSWLFTEGRAAFGEVVFWAMMFNLVPDFVSLWETRVVTKWASARRRSLGTLLMADLSFTTLLSGAAIGGVLVFAAQDREWAPRYDVADFLDASYEVASLQPNGFGMIPMVIRAERPSDLRFTAGDVDAWHDEWEAAPPGGAIPQWAVWPNLFGADDIYERAQTGEFDIERGNWGLPIPLGVFFYSAFATSAWLWLHAAAVLLSRFLLRMNSGVGFLLRVTDVERQPFRSMGFVSVIIVSGLFLMGLPFVLL